jgi:hypothetical protein
MMFMSRTWSSSVRVRSVAKTSMESSFRRCASAGPQVAKRAGMHARSRQCMQDDRGLTDSCGVNRQAAVSGAVRRDAAYRVMKERQERPRRGASEQAKQQRESISTGVPTPTWWCRAFRRRETGFATWFHREALRRGELVETISRPKPHPKSRVMSRTRTWGQCARRHILLAVRSCRSRRDIHRLAVEHLSAFNDKSLT